MGRRSDAVLLGYFDAAILERLCVRPVALTELRPGDLLLRRGNINSGRVLFRRIDTVRLLPPDWAEIRFTDGAYCQIRGLAYIARLAELER